MALVNGLQSNRPKLAIKECSLEAKILHVTKLNCPCDQNVQNLVHIIFEWPLKLGHPTCQKGDYIPALGLHGLGTSAAKKSKVNVDCQGSSFLTLCMVASLLLRRSKQLC